ncbi:MAG: hypothetical protein KF760_18915 [Candidatus Eremiobacteraeota bacterium]|nr:hypothetical protein [Candidatus Eremiobacteraeota bacterium]MCW5868471.1 hypothetical protein [Candidatus Eremiobacteraeota bacterium]
MNFRKPQDKTGMALVALVLLITSVFVLMTAGAGELLNTSMRQASRAQSNRRTNYCSYAIMQRALDKLSTNLLYSVDPAESGAWETDPELVYQLTIYNNYAGTFSNPAPDGRYVPPYMVYIKVKADYRDYPGRFTSSLFSKAYVGGQACNFAIVGTEKVTITDSVVDAWYIRAPVDPAGTYTLTRSGQGRVVTNSIQPNHLNIGGASWVNANVYWGPTGLGPSGPGSVLNVTSTVATPIPSGRTQAPATSPTRVPRYHPPANPTLGSMEDKVYGAGTASLAPGAYKSLSVTGGNLNLAPGEYYFANNITLTNANVTVPAVSGAHPCDIYLGKTFTATHSSVNWDHTLKTVSPEAPLAPATLADQAQKGPRTMRVFFVGSGAPNFKDCKFIVEQNSKVALHASGKAMRVKLTDSVMWGGVKGYEVVLENSQLYYHRVMFDT